MCVYVYFMWTFVCSTYFILKIKRRKGCICYSIQWMTWKTIDFFLFFCSYFLSFENIHRETKTKIDSNKKMQLYSIFSGKKNKKNSLFSISSNKIKIKLKVRKEIIIFLFLFLFHLECICRKFNEKLCTQLRLFHIFLFFFLLLLLLLLVVSVIIWPNRNSFAYGVRLWTHIYTFALLYWKT